MQNEIPSRARAEISLAVFDENGNRSEKESIEIVTGIANNDWQADWINPELNEATTKARKASYLKKIFFLSGDQVTEAKKKGAFIYATCHGIMDIEIGGVNVTTNRFMPGTQQYDMRLMVETIEVSSFLREGANEVIVSIGDGWYRGAMGYDQQRNVYGKDLALLMQLEIDGNVIVKTDLTWQATQDGPIGHNDFMDGEDCDARRMLSIAKWHKVSVAKFGFKNLICRDVVPMIEHEVLNAKLIRTPRKELVLDFSQNIVGYVSFDINAKEGQKLTLIHGEVLDENGNFSIENFQHPKMPVKQCVNYICKEGSNNYHPTKTYMGFRYVKVDADFEIRPEDFKAIAVYSDMPVTAEFSCGVPEVNRLFQNALWSMKGNFIDVPTDCPTREKSGYSGDCQTYIHTAMYLMDCYSVYAKWIREQAAGQYKDGMIPQIAPKCSAPRKKPMIGFGITTEGGIGWSDSFEIVPYRLMKRYGDTSLIEEQYEALKCWTEYEIKRANKTRLCNCRLLPKQYRKNMIDTGWMWGEWLEPGQGMDYIINMVTKGDLEVGTAFYYMNLCYMRDIAEILNKIEDVKYYNDRAERVKAAYRAVYLENGRVKETKRQCCLVRPIAHNLLTEKEKQETAKTLAQMVSKNGNHLNTGFLTTHELCRSLSNNGQKEKAYDLLLQKSKPSWLYSVEKGCTTIPESWDCFDDNGKPQSSFNHYSYGAICGWLMDSVCGIKVENGAITIAPQPDKRLGYAEAAYDSPYGKIISGWRYSEDGINYHIEVPSNMMANIKLEGKEEFFLSAGKYDFSNCIT